MSPAFSSVRQAAGFAGLLFLLLGAPGLVPSAWLPPRGDVYLSMRDEEGPFPFLHRQIFLENGPIDLAFVGSSHVWAGIDVRQVRDQLSRHLGREATVVTLGWPWAGFDALYFVARDLLRHREVRMLVVYDDVALGPDGRVSGEAHRLAPRWFRWSEDRGELDGLSIRDRATYYFASIVGMPRQVLDMLGIRGGSPRDRLRPSHWETKYRALGLEETGGALCAKLGIDHDPTAYVDFAPAAPARASAAVRYSPETRDQFSFAGPPTPLIPMHFAQRLARLARETRVPLVLLNFPDIRDLRSPTIRERECWPATLGGEVAMVGVPPAELFAGLTDAQVGSLYYDHGHFNRNGQEVYTKWVYPRLQELHEATLDP